MELTVAVIIPTFNREEVLCQTIRQFLDQDRPPNEIVIVDQSDTHESTTREFLADVSSRKGVRLIQQATPSPSQARNRGILESTSDILLFVDDDVVINRDFVRRHVVNYDNEQTVAVSGPIWTEAGKPVPVVSELPSDLDKDPLAWMEFPLNVTVRTERICVRTGNLSVRRDFAVKIGGFDENFGHLDYHGDYDFGLRISRAGGKIMHDPLAGIHHLAASRGGCRPWRKLTFVPHIEELRPKLYFFIKNFPNVHSVHPILRLLRQQVFNRGNVLRPYYLVLSIGVALAAFYRAAYEAAVVGERSSVR
jgi:GT2 family glycosyltransferase